MSRRDRHLFPARTVLLFLGAASFLAACSSSSDDNSGPVLAVGTTDVAVASNTPLVMQGNWVAFLADEAASGNTDFNGDGDTIDSIAYAVNVASKVEVNLGVAARELAWLGTTLFISVQESFDGRDWGGNPGTTDRVLLRWSHPAVEPVFVDVLSQASERTMAVVGDKLFYASGNVPVGAMTSNLRVIESADPGDPHEVLTNDLVGALSPRIIGTEGELVLLALDETAEGRDLNGDGDALDTAVLALLDGQGTLMGIGYSFDVLNTELAMPSTTSPLRARAINAGGRAVGFLVDESAQGNTNLNLFDGNTLPASWYPPQCPAQGDTDTNDDVLHYVRFESWQSNPVANPPVNTGIVGANRIVMTGSAVGTLSPESMEGTCSLNGDGDQDDTVFRWIRFGQAPVTDVDLILAVDTSVPGPAQGVAELSGRFVIQVDEAADDRDWDGTPGTERELLGFIDPSVATPSWKFNNSPSGTPSYAVATWFGETPSRTRLGVAFAESSNDQFLNPNPPDNDKLDSVPTFARIDTSSAARLAFPGVAFATDRDNAGIAVISGWAFYRISEAEDSRDWNGDGVLNDFVLLATNLDSGQTIYLGVLNTLTRPAAEGQTNGGGGGAAFLVSEAMAGDLNGDGDTADFVVRYVKF